jgi:hypothetical protein
VHAPLEVETVPKRNAPLCRVIERSVAAAKANLDVTWEQRPERREHERDDEDEAVLQVRHGAATERWVRAWNL